MPWISVLASRLPNESVSWTAPLRNPGAPGANVMLTVHELPAVWLPVQVVLPRVKSRFGRALGEHRHGGTKRDAAVDAVLQHETVAARRGNSLSAGADVDAAEIRSLDAWAVNRAGGDHVARTRAARVAGVIRGRASDRRGSGRARQHRAAALRGHAGERIRCARRGRSRTVELGLTTGLKVGGVLSIQTGPKPELAMLPA